MRSRYLVVTAAIVAAFFAGRAVSEEKAQSPEETMAAWMKLNTPGPQHDVLKKMAGKFTAETSMMMAPGAPPQTGKGEETNDMVLDGRFLNTEYTGEFMGAPFKGMGVTGYDTVKKKYVMGWIDSMSTGIMMMEGDADASGKTITFAGETPCPMNGGKMMPIRQIMKITDDDTHELQMFGPGPDGKEMQTMTIKYTRAK